MAAAIHLTMMTKGLFAKLNSDVFLCDGAYYSIILNCNNGKIYQLDREAKSYIDRLLKGELYAPLLDHENDELIRFLLSNELISLTEEYAPSQLLPQAIPHASLNTVWLELRRSCNLKCLHCYNSSNPSSDRIDDLLTPEQWKSVIAQLKDFDPHTLIFIGGEPLMYAELTELIDFAGNELPDTRLVLYSNLTILNDSTIQCIKQRGVKVVTSLYSSTPDIHDSITQMAGSFNKTVSAIKKLKDEGIPVKANTVMMRQNQHCAKETLKYIKDITGLKPKLDIIRCVHDELRHLTPSNVSDPHIISSAEQLSAPTLKKLSRALSGNPCWQDKINISYNGYVSPCIMWQPEETESACLTTNTLYDVLQKYIRPIFWSLSKDKIKICCDCEYRYICRDCRPISGSLYDRGDTCKYDPYTGSWRE